MEKQTKSPKEVRQRKFMLVLPLLALPFMTMIFWALGGGKVQQVEAQGEKQAGFNLKLPDADFKDDQPKDKLGYYDQAWQDSVRFLELMKNDPNYKDMTFSDTDDYMPDSMEDDYGLSADRRGINTSLYGGSSSNDPNTDKIYRKLAELDREMNKPASTPDVDTYPNQYTGSSNGSATVSSSDIDRLEQMMDRMSQPE